MTFWNHSFGDFDLVRVVSNQSGLTASINPFCIDDLSPFEDGSHQLVSPLEFLHDQDIEVEGVAMDYFEWKIFTDSLFAA